MQAVIFSFLEAKYQSYLIQNEIFLISKLHIYKSRKNKFLNSTYLLKEIRKIKNAEKKVASASEKKTLNIKESREKLKKKSLKEVINLKRLAFVFN